MPFLATLLLTAQTVAPVPLSSQVCLATSVTAPGQRVGRGTPAFSAVDTLSLEMRTQIRPVVTGDHLLRLKVYTPRGYLYQTFTVPFRFESLDSDEKNVEEPATRVVPGFPRPLPVQTLGSTSRSALSRRTTSLDQATARLPVAGTSITLGSLFGQWTVVPYLDDGTAPCGPARTFEIRE